MSSTKVPGDGTPTVSSVRIEALPGGSNGTRCAVVEWTDRTEGEALRWYDDEILFSEGDLLGKTASEVRALKFSRDRDYLQS